jgi:TonB-linked SusC/RagA family outer membrane protein
MKYKKNLLKRRLIFFKILGSIFLILGTIHLNAQSDNSSIKITGLVQDSEQLPLIGATINDKNDLSVATVTDDEGVFTLTVSGEDAVLQVRYVGYKPYEFTVGSNRIINIVLEPELSQVEQVVVVGYGEQSRTSVLGAISSVEVNELQLPDRDLSNNLAGQIAGVIGVTRNGEPGYDDNKFWIRGIGTFNTSAQEPLILVDGIERDIRNIDPEEIASFSILKDATATAVYGVNGANGVILVTTKRGKSAVKPSVSFRSEYGTSSPTQLPEFVDAATFMELYNEATSTSGADIQPYSDELIMLTRSGIDPDIYPNVNWIDELLADYATNQRYNLTVSGGTPIVRYSATASYYQEGGILKSNPENDYNSNIDLKRYNFRTNIDADLTNSTSLRLNLGGYLVNANYPGNTTQDIFNAALNAPPNVFPTRYSNGQNVATTNVGNPYNMLAESGFATQARNSLQSLFEVKQDLNKLTEGLSVKFKFSFDAYNNNGIDRKKIPSTFVASGRDSEGKLITFITNTGDEGLGYGTWNSANSAVYYEGSINYKRSFSDVHQIGGLLLGNRRDYRDYTSSSGINSLPYRRQGLAGRVTYAYNDKYFTEVNFGLNGSENFPKEKRYGFFPSFALGWVVSQEPFMYGISNIVSNLKVRGSYGMVGNSAIPNRRFAYIATVNENAQGYNFGVTGANYLNGNSEDQFAVDLTWETATKVNFGLDLGLFFEARLTVDVFKEWREDILMNRESIPIELGLANNPQVNFGKMENEGLDASLNINHSFNANFSVNLRGNFTFARNKITEHDDPVNKPDYQKVAGYSVNQHRGYIAERLYTEEDFVDVENSILQASLPTPLTNVRPGDIKYKDVSGDGEIDPDDVTPIGSTLDPRKIYGFGATVRFKQFDFAFYFKGVADATLILGQFSKQFYPFYQSNTKGNIYTAIEDRWTEDNPSQDVMYPRLAVGAHSNYEVSTWWLRNSSFLRLQNIELGYSIPSVALNRMKINSARFFLRGNNLLTMLTEIDLWDPALDNDSGMGYPPNRRFSAGFSLNF